MIAVTDTVFVKGMSLESTRKRKFYGMFGERSQD